MLNQGYEKLPSKTGGGRNNGIDGLYIKRNEAGDIESIVIVESKWNTARYGSAWYAEPGNSNTINVEQRRTRVRQMSFEWIDQKARDMMDSDDPATMEAGRMLYAALYNDPYRGRLNPNGQMLTRDMIDTREYRIFKIEMVNGEKSGIRIQ